MLKKCLSSSADFHYYSKLSTNFRNVIITLDKESEERKISLLIDSEKITKLEEAGKLLTNENLDLKRKLSDSEKIFEKEKKRLELKCLTFSKLISDFKKLVICEREKFEKEKTAFETKSMELSCKISELQKTLEKERNESDFERKESEQLKVQRFQELSQKEDFERERLYLRSEVKRLTTRFIDLSAEIRKERKLKSDLQSQFDLCNKERNDLVFKVKELGVNFSNVGSSDQNSPDTIDQSSYGGSTRSKSSDKTTSSSRNKNSSSKGFIKPNKFSKNQMKTLN